MNKKTITLVACDVDGTLLDSHKQLTSRNREVIQRLKDKGILFGIASGRSVEGVRLASQQWNIDKDISFIIGMNGGTFYDMRQRVKEDFHLLPGNKILEIYEFFKDLPVEFWLLDGLTRYTSKSTPESREHAKSFHETEVEVNLYDFLQRMI